MRLALTCCAIALVLVAICMVVPFLLLGALWELSPHRRKEMQSLQKTVLSLLMQRSIMTGRELRITANRQAGLNVGVIRFYVLMNQLVRDGYVLRETIHRRVESSGSQHVFTIAEYEITYAGRRAWSEKRGWIQSIRSLPYLFDARIIAE